MTRDRISVGPTRIEAIEKWPTPKLVLEVRCFLGLAGYYIRFVIEFSRIATLLIRLT